MSSSNTFAIPAAAGAGAADPTDPVAGSGEGDSHGHGDGGGYAASSSPSPIADIPVISTSDLSREQLLSFPAFRIWFFTLQHSLSLQAHPSHEFNKSPYVLRKIDIQAVDYFGSGNRKRLGFIKFKADVSNDSGESLPGSVFLRGGSVAMLLILQPNDLPTTSEAEKSVILTIQPRIPAGSLSFPEIPAGMLDEDRGTFAGVAAREIQEETGLVIPSTELIDMTALALGSLQQGQQQREDCKLMEKEAKKKIRKSSHGMEGEEGGDQQEDEREHEIEKECLQKGVYPSPGGSDEFIPIFLCQKRMEREEIEMLKGKLTGLRDEREKITLKLVPLEELWKEGLRDAKSLAAWALYEGLKREGRI